MTEILSTTELWPSLAAPEKSNQSPKNVNDWEFVTGSDTEEPPEMRSNSQTKILHRCPSSPNFMHRKQDDSSYVLDCSSSSIDAQSVSTDVSIDDAVVLTKRPPSNSTMRKVPSFKDVMMLNAESQLKEREEQLKLKEQEERIRKESMKRRKAKPRIVVNPIKRCTKSTGDLRSLVSIQEDEEDEGFGGGSGGGFTIHEEEVLGETDAAEFYFRKAKGSSNRINGEKLRPDEATRKDMIIAKKNAQRAAQGKPKK